MTRYKITIEYDGTTLVGWQKQQEGNSVQEYLEKALNINNENEDALVLLGKIYFDENPMPTHALTMGIKQIMSAKKIVLIATGSKKAEAVKNMVEGAVTPQVPASILQQHNDVIIFLDEAAASLLK